MSIVRRRFNDKVYLYLQLTGKQFYLGVEGKIKPDRVYKALSYLRREITARHERDLKYYEKVKRILEDLLSEEERRRREEIQTLVNQLDPEEMKIVVRLSLTEKGFSPYELEELGILPVKIMPIIRKLSKLGIIEKRSETETPAGRKIVKYVTNTVGARIALEFLRKTSEDGLKEEKLHQMAEGNFDFTPIGMLLKQISKIKVKKIE